MKVKVRTSKRRSATTTIAQVLPNIAVVVVAVVVSLVLIAASCCCPFVSAQENETETTTETVSTESVSTESVDHSQHYLEPEEKILTPEGEVAVDHEHGGAKLPESLNDGELEGGDHHTEWNYLDQTKWAGEYPTCKGVKLRQSPIDIITDKVVFNTRMKLEFLEYDQEVEFELKNTHHSVSLVPIASLATPALRVNWVSSKDEDNLYELQEIHFHWGDGINKGSEHEINDQRAAAEMHMVHYRKGLNKSQMGTIENSVVVIGVFIESDAVEHNKLESLVARVQHVNGTDAQYRDDNPENLINLLPENHHSFYTYNGSLTTPPCFETVTWIIMSEPVYMSQERLQQLSNLERQMPGAAGQRQKIASNHRDIQPLRDRPVYASFNTTDSTTLDQNAIGKLIGKQDGILDEALEEYWTSVNKLKVSVKKAYQSIGQARQKLLLKLGLGKKNKEAEVEEKESTN